MVKHIVSVFMACICLQVQAWSPPETVTVTVGQSPGGGNEFAFRAVQKHLERSHPNTKFVFDYRPGMDSVVSINHFARLPNDGRHIYMMLPITGFVTGPVVYKNYFKTDPQQLVPVTAIAQSPFAIIVPQDSPIRTLADFVAYLRTQKTDIGLSGASNLLVYSYIVDWIKPNNGLSQSVNFKSPMEASVAVASRSITAAIVPVSVPKGLIDAGKVRVIAHTGDQTIKGLESSELAASQIPGLIMHATFSVFLPYGTSSDIVKWYETTFVNAIAQDDVREFLKTNWASIDSNTLGSDKLSQHIGTVINKWMPVARRVLKPE